MTTKSTNRYFTVLFRDHDMKQAMRLTPEGGVTNRVMLAAMIDGRERAEEIAAEIRANFPRATVTVRPF